MNSKIVVTFVYLFLYATKCLTAQIVQDVVELDTILITELVATSDQVHGKSLCDGYKSFSMFTIEPYNYQPKRDLLLYNKRLNSYKNIEIIFPEDVAKKIKKNRGSLMSFCFNEKYLVLLYSNFFIVFNFDVHTGVTTFNKHIEYTTKSTTVRFLSDETIVLADCYNYHPMDKLEKVTIQTYDLANGKWSKIIKPEFKDIEFTNFNPNQWVDARDGRIVITNTSEYLITVFNSDLDKICEIKKDIPTWKRMDTSVLSKFRKSISPSHAYVMIDSLSPYADHLISRITHVFLLPQSKMGVVYYHYSDSARKRLRYIDIWDISSSNPNLIYSGLKDFFSANVEEETKKETYEFLYWNNPTSIIEDGFVQFRSLANIKYVGNTKRNIILSENEYLKNNQPLLGIIVYRIK